MRIPSRHPSLRLVPGVLALLVAVGCGMDYPLPTEKKVRLNPPLSESYGMVATWTGMNGINDIHLTQGSGSQMFLLFNTGGVGTAPRGAVYAYPRTQPTPLPLVFDHMFNPAKLYAGNNRLFVLDQGDTCLARADTLTGSCTAPGWQGKVTHLDLYWRVREYGLLGGDTISTFTDTTMAWVNGIAADNEGRVYVSGVQIVLVIDPNDSRLHSREFHFQINRYSRGPRYPGVVPYDRNMPGCLWHRDTTWVVLEGSGIGSVVDARGLAWGPLSAPAFYAADYGKDWAQKMSSDGTVNGLFEVDYAEGQSLKGPQSVAVDNTGYMYVVDNGNGRVLRFASDGTFIQRVDLEPDAQGQHVVDPVGVAVDDSVAYVADRALAKVIRYQRRRL